MLLITQPRSGTFHNEILALQMAAREEGWDVFTAPHGWRLDEELISSGKQGVPYGSQIFCETIAQQMGWVLKANAFDWLAKLPEYYLKRKVQFMTLGEAQKLTETKFIKPADDKVFSAKVYNPGELVVHESIPKETPTLVSDIVMFDLEYRCFVNKNRVKTWSNYIFYDNIADPRFWNMVPIDDAKNSQRVNLPSDWVNDVIHHLNYHSNIELQSSVIDVGRIPGKGWAIIETNPAWASGLYGCDPISVLEVLESSCANATS